MLKRRLCLVYLTLLLGGFTVFAQTIEIKTNENESIKITPTGRFYLDGAAYVDDQTDLGNGVYMNDIRVGLKAKYKQFDIKVDVGFAGGKVSAKDVFFQYNLNKHSYLRTGHFAEPFGIDHMESSSNIKFITPNASSSAFSPGRKLGLEYIGWNKYMWVGAGLFADGDAMKNSIDGDDGFSVTGRWVLNPLQKKGRILHVGLSGSYRKADASGYNEDGEANLKRVVFESRLNTNVERRKGLNAVIIGADYQAKYAVELIGAYGPVFLQAEYFNALVEQVQDWPTYKASGAYAQVGVLAIGGDYAYSSSWARMGSPKPKSLEFVLRYNYTDLNDGHAGVKGGIMSDWSFAANYYLNKYVMFRLNYSYMSLGENNPFAAGEDIHSVQARVQVVF